MTLKIIPADGHRAIYGDDGHGKIATVHLRRTKTNNTTDMEHWTRLFAAAPDLLDVCQRITRLPLVAAALSQAGNVARAQGLPDIWVDLNEAMGDAMHGRETSARKPIPTEAEPMTPAELGKEIDAARVHLLPQEVREAIAGLKDACNVADPTMQTAIKTAIMCALDIRRSEPRRTEAEPAAPIASPSGAAWLNGLSIRKVHAHSAEIISAAGDVVGVIGITDRDSAIIEHIAQALAAHSIEDDCDHSGTHTKEGSGAYTCDKCGAMIGCDTR